MTKPHKALFDHAQRIAERHIVPVVEGHTEHINGRTGVQYADLNPALLEPTITLYGHTELAPLVIVLPLPSKRDTPSPFFVRAFLTASKVDASSEDGQKLCCTCASRHLNVKSMTIPALVEAYLRNPPTRKAIQDILDAHFNLQPFAQEPNP